MDEDFFRNRKLNLKRLLAYGFIPRKEGYTWETDLHRGLFRLKILITVEGKVETQIFDCITGDEYLLFKVVSAAGAFVGQIRQSCEKQLAEIAERCFDADIFKSGCAQKVIEHVREKYTDELEFLWERFSGNAVFRRQDNAKWYAALLTVRQSKLGLADDTPVEIIDLRLEPEAVEKLVDGQRYFAGYHMNKKHWITIRLDGSVPVEEIYQRIHQSHEIAGR